ncbi:glycine-rich protein 5-like [Olea europaea var. sylvestris]|uniref:glycine-rich protein 5-like n=1 Tax=Olea europaea var. sylvestris TaxID=158386 RepID=UPI000C1CFCA1|nr:glycine-rich protein 5-like [Olea europaea var. sylvestris]
MAAKWCFMFLLALVVVQATARVLPSESKSLADQKNVVSFGGAGVYSGIGNGGLPFGGVVGGVGSGGNLGGIPGFSGVGGVIGTGPNGGGLGGIGGLGGTSGLPGLGGGSSGHGGGGAGALPYP